MNSHNFIRINSASGSKWSIANLSGTEFSIMWMLFDIYLKLSHDDFFSTIYHFNSDNVVFNVFSFHII